MRGAVIFVGFGATVALLAALVVPQVSSRLADTDLRPTGAIRGRVVGLIFPGIDVNDRGEVYLKRISVGPEQRTPIPPDGRFEFTGLEAGEYQLVVAHKGEKPLVRERVVVGHGVTDAGEFAVETFTVCQCSAWPPPTGVRAYLAHGAGSRVPFAWIAVDPVKPVQRYGIAFPGLSEQIGPRLVCLCGREVDDLGRTEYFDLPPGIYRLTAFAVGYERVIVSDVVVKDGQLTDVWISWTPSTVPGDVAASVLPGQVLTRIDTPHATLWIAIDAWKPVAKAFLARLDARQFEGGWLSAQPPLYLADADRVPFGYAFATVPATGGEGIALIQGGGNARQVIGWALPEGNAHPLGEAFRSSAADPFAPVLSVARVRDNYSPLPLN